MDADEYQKLALRTEKTPAIVDFDKYRQATETAIEPTRMDRLIHAALGVCTEAGELQDALKRHLIYGKDFDPTNVMEECGDLLWYIALALHATGYTMGEAMARNIAKLRARYPEGFTEAQALTRDFVSERNALMTNSAALEERAWARLKRCGCALRHADGNGFCQGCGGAL
jgi:NTP pyrophosphatase (non-canonical NTP hydrolase)